MEGEQLQKFVLRQQEMDIAERVPRREDENKKIELENERKRMENEAKKIATEQEMEEMRVAAEQKKVQMKSAHITELEKMRMDGEVEMKRLDAQRM